jgi:hypothetical protein
MAIYCPDQHVVHDGITKSKDKCPDCIKADQELLFLMEGGHKDDRSDLCRTNTGSTRVESDGEGLDLEEDYHANGSLVYVPSDCDGSAMWSSNEEWQLVQHRELERQKIAGREDNMVVDHDGEPVNEPLHMVGESEWMTRGRILPHPTIPGDQEPNTGGTEQERMWGAGNWSLHLRWAGSRRRRGPSC